MIISEGAKSVLQGSHDRGREKGTDSAEGTLQKFASIIEALPVIARAIPDYPAEIMESYPPFSRDEWDAKKYQSSEDIAVGLVKAGYGVVVAAFLPTLAVSDHSKVADAMIKRDEGVVVLGALEHFSGVNHRQLMDMLTRRGEAELVDQHISKFRGEYFDRLKAFHLLPSEYRIVRRLIQSDAIAEDTYKKIFLSLQERSPFWKRQDALSASFQAGADYFGYAKMFRYIGQESRHDMLHVFPLVLESARASAMRPEQFYSSILDQVANDDVNYFLPEPLQGARWLKVAVSARQYLNHIMQSLSTVDDGYIASVVEQYPQLSRLRSFSEDFRGPRKYKNWKTLKKYFEIVAAAQRDEFSDFVSGMQESDPVIARYVESLVLHPGVDVGKAILFLKDPDAFLALPDHTATAVMSHESRKPSNYTNVDYLDLTSRELRDALVHGEANRAMDWQPLAITYAIPRGMFALGATPIERFLRAAGSRREKKAGLARDPMRLFRDAERLCHEKGIRIADVLQDPSTLSSDVAAAIDQLVFHPEFGIPVETDEYRAVLHRKDDRETALSGTDLSNCMSFGSGKTALYMFHPGCAVFTIQKKSAEGWSIIAGSVLTKDQDVGMPAREAFDNLVAGDPPPDEFLPESALSAGSALICADNVEVKKNFSSHPYANTIIEGVLQDFFSEYSRRYSSLDASHASDRMIIGDPDSTHLPGTQRVKNTFVSQAALGYSDNTKTVAYLLALGKLPAPFYLHRTVEESKEIHEPFSKRPIVGHPHIFQLTYRDALAVAYLEAVVYKDSPSEYINGYNDIHNVLVAKDYSVHLKGWPDLSFAYRDKDAKLKGSLIAYQGVHAGEQVIYISEFMVLPSSRMVVGGALIRAFADTYRTQYIEKGLFTPILADARESSTFQLLQNKLDSLARDIGVTTKLHVLQKGSGDDPRHLIKIEVMKAEKSS